jgi:mRNA interferase YafQ
MLTIIYTTSFKKDYKKILRQGKNITKLDDILYQLAHRIPLDQKFRDHKLSGSGAGKRDCHIEPDWLLIYEITSKELFLYRTGSHSEIFGK